MRCKFTFQVDGTLTLGEPFPIHNKFYRYEFIREGNLLTHLIVSVPVPDKKDWPYATPNPAPGVKYQIGNLVAPQFPFVQVELRTLQGILSPFGVRIIDIDQPVVEWIAENENERQELILHGYEKRRKNADLSTLPQIGFDIVARAIIAADEMYEISTPLNFFRRGCRDVEDEQHIEGIYDFYFVLETLYANGKFKTDAVLKEFCASKELRSAVQQTTNNPGPLFTMDKDLGRQFANEYQRLSTEQFLEKLIELRGFLHHHARKRPGIWNPENQRNYKLHSAVFQDVAYNVIFPLIREYLWRTDLIEHFQSQYRKHLSSKGETPEDKK